MTKRLFPWRGVPLLVAVGLAILPICLNGQTVQPEVAADAHAVRTPWGHPDLQGVWHRIPMGSAMTRERNVKYPAVNANEERPYPALWGQSNTGNVKEKVRAVDKLPLGIVDPPDGSLPWRPDALKKRQLMFDNYNDPKTLEYLDPGIYCMPPGVPFSAAGLFEIVQTPAKVALLYEYQHLTRVFPLDGRPHLPSEIRLFMGDSRARWEKDTLVVETTNFVGKGWHNIMGTFQSDAMRTVERFTKVDRDTIAYRVTVDDPKVFERPWTTAGAFVRAAPDVELLEAACVEGTVIAEQVEHTLQIEKPGSPKK